MDARALGNASLVARMPEECAMSDSRLLRNDPSIPFARLQQGQLSTSSQELETDLTAHVSRCESRWITEIGPYTVFSDLRIGKTIE